MQQRTASLAQRRAGRWSSSPCASRKIGNTSRRFWPSPSFANRSARPLSQLGSYEPGTGQIARCRAISDIMFGLLLSSEETHVAAWQASSTIALADSASPFSAALNRTHDCFSQGRSSGDLPARIALKRHTLLASSRKAFTRCLSGRNRKNGRTVTIGYGKSPLCALLLPMPPISPTNGHDAINLGRQPFNATVEWVKNLGKI